MRIGDGASARRAAEGSRRRRFDDALGRAAAAQAIGGRFEATAPAGPAPARRPAAPRDRAQMPRGERAGEDAGPLARAPLPTPSLHIAEPPAPPELRALVRALPVAVETFGVRDGAPLALSLGGSLDVELRAVQGGVELVLRADARLARACAAGIPGLVAALGRRGVSVVRAEVRGRAGGLRGGVGGTGPRLPFVDLPVPLR
jgi:hypothetical protein